MRLYFLSTSRPRIRLSSASEGPSSTGRPVEHPVDLELKRSDCPQDGCSPTFTGTTHIVDATEKARLLSRKQDKVGTIP